MHIWLSVLAALAFSLIIDRETLLAVWRDNIFRDTDDAMRMVEARDLLAGQNWFDLTVHRLAPPAAMTSHWSRLIDAPLVALNFFFRLFLSPDLAERATRIIFPLACLAALYRVSIEAVRVFAGQKLALAGPAACALTGVAAWQFSPGRVDHHGPQIVLLLAATAELARAFDPREAPAAGRAGAAIALCLGIGLENLPFFAVLTVALGLIWLARGRAAAPALKFFAAGLAVTLLPVYAAAIAPSRWLLSFPDALSFGQLAAILAVAAAFAALAQLRAENFFARLGWAALAAVLAVGAALAVAPGLLKSPFDGLDPVLRGFWLDHVAEMQPFWAFTQGHAVQRASFVAPFVFAMSGAAVAAWRGAGVLRARALLLLSLLMLGGVMSLIEIRCASSIAPLLAIGALTLIAQCRDFCATPAKILGAVLLTSRLGAALAAGALAPVPEASPATALTGSGACFAPKAFAALKNLPPGAAVSQIDVGPFLLAFTDHTIIAAPYHRNNAGNLLALELLTGDPAQAEILAHENHLRWIFLCAAPEKLRDLYVGRNPSGLAAQLIAGQTPDWLKKITLDDSPFLGFEILAASNKRQN